jgi:hypothetical protein
VIAEALQSRLKVLEDEISRLTKLAAQSSDQVDQDKYWRLAKDLQREARALRGEIAKALSVGGQPSTRRGQDLQPKRETRSQHKTRKFGHLAS